MRVALLNAILPPYRRPVYEALARTPGWTLRVLLSAETEFDRSWRAESGELDVEVAGGLSFRHRNRSRSEPGSDQVVTVHIPLAAFSALRRFRPDAIISAELGARTLLAFLYSRLFRVPLVVWTYHSRTSAANAGRLRRFLWRLLGARGDAIIGMGTQAREVLTGWGISDERIHDAPNAHDREGLRRARADVDPADVAALRAGLGCRRRVALVPGRLVPVKGIDALLRAWKRLPRERRDEWTLLFVGDGPEAVQVDAAAAPGEIVRVPEVPFDDLARYYAASDLVVFSSLGDNWGLVVNEAFECGLPVLCSSLAGCADDLVRNGRNGWRFDPTDDNAFSRALGAALATPDLERMGAEARATAARFGPEAMAEGMRAAVDAAMARARDGRRRLATVTLLLVSAVLCALGGEAVLRLAVDEVNYLQPALRSHPVLPVVIEPGSAGHDAWGFRNPGVPERADIVAIGDSQTYGSSTPADRAWPASLGRLANRSVYSLALGGYGPPDYRYLFEEFGAKLRPDVAVIGFYFGNDLHRSYESATGEPFALSAGREKSGPRRFGAGRTWLARHSVLYQAAKYRLPALADLVRRREASGDGTLAFEHAAVGTRFSPAKRLEVLDQGDARNRIALAKTLEILAAIDVECTARGTRALFLLIPTKESVYWELARAELGGAGSVFAEVVRQEGEVRRAMLAFFEREGLRFVDALPPLRRAAESEALYPPSEDGHPTPAGHRILAEAVWKALGGRYATAR